MRLNTKLMITGITMVVLPLVLITLVLRGIGHPIRPEEMIAIALTLLFTSILLTIWISRSVTEPINELNRAMQHIRDGDFEFRLLNMEQISRIGDKGEENGEIGELYRSYEDMRLRLKESAEEKLLHEQQNQELSLIHI